MPVDAHTQAGERLQRPVSLMQEKAGGDAQVAALQSSWRERSLSLCVTKSYPSSESRGGAFYLAQQTPLTQARPLSSVCTRQQVVRLTHLPGALLVCLGQLFPLLLLL